MIPFLICLFIVYPVVGLIVALAAHAVDDYWDVEFNLPTRIAIGVTCIGIIAYITAASYVMAKLEDNELMLKEAKECLPEFLHWIKTGE